MPDEPKYMNIGDAADALGVTRKTVYTMVKDGRLPAIVNPLDARERLIPREEVDKLKDFATLKKAGA